MKTLPALLCSFPFLLMLSCRDTTAHAAQTRGLTIQKVGEQSIRQGDSLSLPVRIVRTQLTDSVTLRITNLPAGVKCAQSEFILTRDEVTATLMLSADPTASPGMAEGVKLTAETASGLSASDSFALTIKPK